MSYFDRIKMEIRQAWLGSAPLTATSFIMLVAFVASCLGIFLDDRSITGVTAWLKPAKFGISTAIFTATIAWLFRYITVWRPFLRLLGWTLAVVLMIEVAIIDVQAARGTTSHFNNGAGLDGALFIVMGTSILVLWLASVGVLIALFRQEFADPAWGWWLRMGMLITVLGAAAGGMMLCLTPEQAEAAKVGRPSTIGAHTVGAPDGGPGIHGLGWSTEHGDLRIAHFLGLHGVQIIPFIGWLVKRRRTTSDRAQVGLAFATATSYLGFIAILAWQALRGQSIVAPDGATLLAFGIWLIATVFAAHLCPRLNLASVHSPCRGEQ